MLRNGGWRRFRQVNVNELERVAALEGRADSQELVANHSSRVQIGTRINQTIRFARLFRRARYSHNENVCELMLRSVSAMFFTSTETAVRSRNCSASVEGWMTSVCGFSEGWISKAACMRESFDAMARVMRRANSMDAG